MLSRLLVGSTLLSVCLPFLANGRSANAEQNVILARDLQIPGTILKPGSYIFSIEDAMQDRTVVRIETADKNTHYLVLTVPNAKLSGSVQNGLILFNSANDATQALKGWSCPACVTALEFVYPKEEAAKIIADTGDSVLAVDPQSEKLPTNLSADDMKVVTLWLLSPKRIPAGDHKEELTAEKYEGPNSASAPSPIPKAHASLAANRTVSAGGRLPQTASNTFSFALWGLLALVTALGLRLKRTRTSLRKEE